MPEFTPIKHKDFNGGNQFVRGDILSPNEINKIIETILYVLKNIDGRIVDGNTITIGNVDDFTASLVDIMASGQVHLWADGYVNIEGDQVTINGLNSDSKITISNTGGISITTEKGQKLALNGNDFAEIVKALQKNISDLQTATKRIVNLEESLSDNMFITNSEVAYERAVPAPVAPYAAVDKIGGMTYVSLPSINLIDPEKVVINDVSENISNYFDIRLDEQAVVHIKKKATPPSDWYGYYNITVQLNAGTYTVGAWSAGAYAGSEIASNVASSTMVGFYSDNDNQMDDLDFGLNSPFTFWTFEAIQNEKITFNIRNFQDEPWDGVADWDELLIKLLLVEGDYSGDWVAASTPYMRNTQIRKLYSTGKNLLDASQFKTTLSGRGFTAQYLPEEDCFLLNGTASASGDTRWDWSIPIKTNTNYALSSFIVSGSVSGGTAVAYIGRDIDGIRTNWLNASVKSNDTQTATSDLSTKTATLCFYVVKDVVFNNLKVRIQFEEGTPTDYTPYSAEPIDTFEIPEAVQALEGYGEGIDASCNNHIEYQDEKVIYKRDLETVVFTGDETKWTDYASTDTVAKYWTNEFDDIIKDKAPAISNKFKRAIGSISEVGLFVISNGSSKVCFGVSKSQYPTVDAWRNQLREWNAAGDPVVIIAAAKNPTVTDITELMSKDNFIKVQSNGRIVAVNEHSQAAPTTITYQKEG